MLSAQNAVTVGDGEDGDDEAGTPDLEDIDAATDNDGDETVLFEATTPVDDCTDGLDEGVTGDTPDAHAVAQEGSGEEDGAGGSDSGVGARVYV